MRRLMGELRLGLRRLRGAPVFAIFSVVTLALSIGATTAIYSVVYAAVLRPPDITDVDRVANLYHMDFRRGASLPMIGFSLPDFEDYRAAQTSFSALAAWGRFRRALVSGGTGEIIMGEMVGGDFFAVVGVEAALGRVIQPADDKPGAPRVIVLSDGLWRRRFGADPAVIGRTVTLGGDTFEIVGVAPARFRGVDMPNVAPTPAWIPLSSADEPAVTYRANRESRWLLVKGRLRPGRTMEEARTELRTIAAQLDAAYPIGRDLAARRGSTYAVSRPWFLIPAGDVRMHESTDMIAVPLTMTVMVSVLLVLLVACTNIANLTLARMSVRRHEFAVRLAIGASRWRLVREQLVEMAIVALAGGAMALGVAEVLIVRVLSATMSAAPGVTVHFRPEINIRAILVCAGATGLSLFVFGILPVLQATRGALSNALASGTEHTAAPRWRGRRQLIALQVAVSAGLIAVAALCAQQLLAAARHNSGIDLERLAMVQLDFQLQNKDEAYARRTLDEATRLVRLQPGVQNVALAAGLPFGTQLPTVYIATSAERIEDGMLAGDKVAYPAYMPSSADIFQVLGVSILEGRAFDDRKTGGSEAVLNQSLARGLFGGASPIGRQIAMQAQRVAGQPVPPIRTATVVGVAADTDTGSFGRRTRTGIAYVPFTREYHPRMSIIARAAGDPALLVDRLRRSISSVDPQLAIFDAGTAIALGGASSPVTKVGAAAATLLGGLALLLAMAGLYGVLSDVVQRRTREIGVRLALGADRSRLTRMIVMDGLRPVLWGLAAGVVFGALLRVSFRPFFLRLFPAFDPIVFVAVPLPFVVAALLAAYLPARRAARVDPNVALRHL